MSSKNPNDPKDKEFKDRLGAQLKNQEAMLKRQAELRRQQEQRGQAQAGPQAQQPPQKPVAPPVRQQQNQQQQAQQQQPKASPATAQKTVQQQQVAPKAQATANPSGYGAKKTVTAYEQHSDTKQNTAIQQQIAAKIRTWVNNNSTTKDKHIFDVYNEKRYGKEGSKAFTFKNLFLIRADKRVIPANTIQSWIQKIKDNPSMENLDGLRKELDGVVKEIESIEKKMWFKNFLGRESDFKLVCKNLRDDVDALKKDLQGTAQRELPIAMQPKPMPPKRH